MTLGPWLPEPIVSPRLVLRPRRDTEADRTATIAMLTDPQVRRYLGGPLPLADAQAAVAGPAGGRWGSFVAQLRDGGTDGGTDGGPVVGGCSLSRERGELEVGYLLLPQYRGRGLASEAVTAVLDWVARTQDDDHVVAVTQAANVASLRLLARLGFTERERLVEYDAEQVLLVAPVPPPAPRDAPAP